MMTLRARLTAVRRQILTSLYARTVPLKDHGPIVSFAFDDFPRTAYIVGGSILKAHGARGTYYTSIGLMNTSNGLGEQFRREDLPSLLQDGHELASHTFSHLSSPSVSCSAFQEDTERGRRAIQEVTGLAGSGNFAFPFGNVTLNAKRTLGPRMTSCRSIFPGFNGPHVDLNLLKANSLYGGVDRSAEAQQLVLENEKRRSWLIFYTHDVGPEPSAYGCTQSLLESTVSFAVRRGCRVMTIQEVMAGLGVCCV
jgi:peptidoglycan/xylan/chitin deacetylase (PgdA/CDA1 family)